MSYLLEMKGITKQFGNIKAVDGVSLQIEQGEIVSLCGENGSGKSTLMKVLCGIYPYGEYQGEIYFSGDVLRANSIRDTEACGIAIIHQELALVKEMTILENVFLGSEWSFWGVLDYERMYLRCCNLLEQVKLDVDPYARVGDLGLGQQQLVEIAKALNKQVRLLILDEPTASLTEKETAVLLNILIDLRNHGISCVYISHKLNEVKAISNTICVIRDGKHIATREAATMTEDKIISMMVGRELSELYPPRQHQSGDLLLSVKNLTAWHPVNTHVKRVNNIEFDLYRGEILGVAGLVGSGRTEMVQCLFGAYAGKWQGEIVIDGQPVAIKNCRDAIDFGIAMVPEDRKKDGIVPIMGVGQNITLAALGNYCNSVGILDMAAEQAIISKSINQLRVKTANIELPIARLSGGNQQKAIIAKCLLLTPRILILDEPTRGIDVGAKHEIYKLIHNLVEQGISVIVVSSELPEVLGISDRVLVMHEGKIKACMDNKNLTQEQVMEAALRSDENV